MKRKIPDSRWKKESKRSITEHLPLGFSERFTCGSGPDEEPDCFQNAVFGFLNQGYPESDAKKTAKPVSERLQRFDFHA